MSLHSSRYRPSLHMLAPTTAYLCWCTERQTNGPWRDGALRLYVWEREDRCGRAQGNNGRNATMDLGLVHDVTHFFPPLATLPSVIMISFMKPFNVFMPARPTFLFELLESSCRRQTSPIEQWYTNSHFQGTERLQLGLPATTRVNLHLASCDVAGLSVSMFTTMDHPSPCARPTSIRYFRALASLPMPSRRFMGSCSTFSTYSCSPHTKPVIAGALYARRC